jgi:hypothetical protein
MLNTLTAKNLIKEHMPVVGSDNGQIAVVDHLEGTDIIKLAQDSEGQHHYIPLTWVDSVDDKVHVDRTADQIMKEWSKTPPSAKPSARDRAAPRQVNSVDATAGQPIVTRVLTRKRELEAARAALPDDDVRTRLDLDLALSTVTELLRGDLKHVPAMVAADMNRWLENNKHLAERATAPVFDPGTGPTRSVVDPGTGPTKYAVDPGTGPTSAPVTRSVVDPATGPVRTPEAAEPESTPKR